MFRELYRASLAPSGAMARRHSEIRAGEEGSRKFAAIWRSGTKLP